MDGRRRSPARLLAPISLVVFVLALLIVIASSGTDDSSDNGNGGSPQVEQTSTTGQTTTAEPEVSGRFYTVKTGDTLAAISEQVGVPVTTLQELNPALDPQALVSGQKIRIRE